MKEKRALIDLIDKELIALLEKRFKLTKEIGRYKQEHNLPIENQTREAEILAKANNCIYQAEITQIYQQIFNQSKAYQSFRYGLIGKEIANSLSPLIHQQLGCTDYTLLETDSFEKTIEKIEFKGINVTNPYKNQAYKWCTSWDESAQVTKAVNTIAEKHGYNTDYLAIKDLVKKYHITSSTKTVIIGNGATAKTINQAIGGTARFLVREIKGKNEFLLNAVHQVCDCEVIINATPYGSHMETDWQPLFSLEGFDQLRLVMDVVYYPLNTPLILEAKRRHIDVVYGVEMLIAQADYANRIFFGKTTPPKKEAVQSILSQTLNIILIGPPFSGKTTKGERLAQQLHKKFIDMDTLLATNNQSLADVFAHGLPETTYRSYETRLAEVLKHEKNSVIATGGGIIYAKDALQHLRAHGIVVFIDEDMTSLAARIDVHSRPLIKSKEDFYRLYTNRYPLYKESSDVIWQSPHQIIDLMEEIYAFIYHQRT